MPPRHSQGGQSWVAEKRYSDFVVLDEVLRSKFWYMNVPKLPGKKFFFNFDDDFVERCAQTAPQLADMHAAIQTIACTHACTCFFLKRRTGEFTCNARSDRGV